MPMLLSLARLPLGLLLCLSLEALAQPLLYPARPGEDAALIRFANVADLPLKVINGAAAITLGTQDDTRVSPFYPIKTGSRQRATVQLGSTAVDIEVIAKPGQLLTVAIFANAGSLSSMVVAESPTDFNASRASVALINLDPACAAAGLTGGAKNERIFSAVKPGTLQRRLINPVQLAVQADCAGQAAGKVLSAGQLEPGERYSVILRNGKDGRQSLVARDRTTPL